MRIAIAYPPLKCEKGVPLLTQNRQFQWFSRPTYIFPVVPATAATMLKQAGHEVLFLDGIAAEMDESEFDGRLAAFKPDLVVLETKTPVVKRHWKWVNGHDYRVVMVGDHVTALPDETLANSKTYAIIPGGDWDYGLMDFIAAGTPAGVQPFALRESIADLPWIDRDLVHWELYAKKNGNFLRTPGTYVMAGRDCWHGKCTFCSWTTLYPKYRVRDAIDVVDEIETLVTKYGVKEIMDDSGSFPVGGWLVTFCNEMIRRGLPKKVRIDCNMRFGRLTFEDYRLMRRAGFRLVLFGVESANQATLDRFVKALKVEDVEKGCEWASKAGLAVHLTFMFGHAWEGPAEIENTVRLARKFLANGWASTLQCTLTVPYPGTPLFKELRANDGLTTLDWDEYDQRRAITKTPLVSEAEIKCAVRRVYRGFLQPRALMHAFRRNLFDFGFYYRGFRYLMGHLLDFRGLALAATLVATASAYAEKQPFERYQPIVDRQMFGPLPDDFDPDKLPTEVQKSAKDKNEKELTREQEQLKSSIHFSAINVDAGGTVMVGFTDNSDAKAPKHYYLRVGQEEDGWKVLEANPADSSMKVAKGEVEVSLTIGGDSAKDGGTAARQGSAASAPAANAERNPILGARSIGQWRSRRRQQEAAVQAEQEKRMKENEARLAQEKADREAEREASRQQQEQQRQQLQAIQEELKRAREERAKRETEKKEDANDASE